MTVQERVYIGVSICPKIVLTLIARENDFGGINVRTAVAQKFLAPFESRTFGDVGLVLELNLRFANCEEGIVLVALFVQVL